MTAYKLMLSVIKTGKKTKEELLTMADVFYAGGRLTANEYTDLLERINGLD